MSNKKLCLMLALGHRLGDARVVNTAGSLSGEYSVGIVAMNMHRGSPVTKNRDITLYTAGGKYKKLFYALKLVRRLRPDIMHCHDLESLVVGFVTKLFNRKPRLIFDVHEFYERAEYKWNSVGGIFANIVVSLLIPTLGRLIDGFIFVAPEQSQFYARFNKPKECVYNFFNLERISNATSSHTQPEKKEFLLIYEGGVGREGGIFEYLATIKKLKAEMPDSKLAIVGWFHNAEARAKTESYIQENGLNDNVVITGGVPEEELPRYIMASKIGLNFIVDSYYNPPSATLSRKLFDYIACGVPVLCSRNMVNSNKLIIDNGCGLAVEYGDTDGAVAAIKQILNNYGEFSNNCSKASRIYNWGNEGRKLLPFYETVLKHGES